ncbi:MAG: LacI family transcriptional regulator [Clostridiales bacterium]|nr:LacI family transcriptional regulator [Clostridiales bacterium]
MAQTTDRKIYTIDEVARELGISKTTVSRAISGKGRISAETRARVLDFIQKHNYRPNMVARGLAQSRTYNICLVLPSDHAIDDMPFFQRCMAGVCEMAASRDYDVVLSMVTDRDASHLQRILENRKVEGVLSTRTTVEDPVVSLMRESDLPFAVIGTSDDPEPTHVDNDQRDACRELTFILLMRGIRNMGLIGGNPRHLVNENRLQGFLDAHESLGIPARQDLIRMGVTNDLQVSKAVEELLAAGCECIVSGDDTICRLVMTDLARRRMRVPEDVKIASFYNSVLLEQSATPVTSLRFDARELGRTACKLLLDRMSGLEVQDETHLGYQVILRESTK